MRIGIFGGSFNPPHRGHMRAAELFCREAGLDRLIIMPAGNPPHKRLSPGSTDLDRLNMARIAFRGIPCAEVSDCEIQRRGESFTVLTLRCLRKIYPDDELILYVGDDMFLMFEKWHSYREIFRLCRLFVMRRTEGVAGLEEKKAMLEREGGIITISDAPPEEMSSSSVRSDLHDGKKPEGLDDEVYDYIIRNGLYRENE